LAIVVAPAGEREPYGDLSVPLALYAQIVGLDECAFWGVSVDTPSQGETCPTVWLLRERKTMARALLEAQEEVENLVRYPLATRWIEGDEVPYRKLVFTTWCHVLEMGQKAVEVLEDSAAVNHGTDPAVITVLNVAADLDVNQVAVFFEDSEVEISPSSVSLSGTTLAIEIPRCRLVKPDLADNDRQGLAYATVANFAASVDVKRIYGDSEVQAQILCRPVCDSGCTGEAIEACAYIENSRLGILRVIPTGCITCSCPKWVRLYYRAGLVQPTVQSQDIVVRLAHAKLPETPCACSVTATIWQRDRSLPPQMTAERANNPFGEASYGAWVAFMWALDMRIIRDKGY
jgi:hypothetical protein